MRNLAEVVPLEECMCSYIVLAAFEEYPSHVAALRLGLDRLDHARAGAARSHRGVDREVRQHGEPDARCLDPFDDRRSRNCTFAVAHQQQV